MIILNVFFTAATNEIEILTSEGMAVINDEATVNELREELTLANPSTGRMKYHETDTEWIQELAGELIYG